MIKYLFENKVRELEKKCPELTNNEDTVKKSRKKKPVECLNCDFVSSSNS